LCILSLNNCMTYSCAVTTGMSCTSDYVIVTCEEGKVLKAVTPGSKQFVCGTF
uniref:Uncharacterized protein n=1 Tax=Amphimedon queenslandica TaxID=400682 RepID=A0A1X7SZV9_AMPQE